MKSLLKIVLAAVTILFVSNAFAQQKVGFINADLLISAMPEREEAMKKLEAFQKESQETYEAMTTEFNTKMQAFEEKKNDYTESILAQKQKELNELYQRLQEYPAIAQRGEQEMWQKQFSPIQEKVMNTISKVAKANGFSYIINATTLLYTDEAQITDILPLAKKELGLQ